MPGWLLKAARGPIRLLAGSACIALLLAGSLHASAAEVRVAVASNFLNTAEKLADQFRHQSGHRVLLSSASSGKLYAQIRHGAPFDLFLSADAERPERLASEGLAVPSQVKSYALGQLVFWAPAYQGDERNCRDYLLHHRDLRLAVANPRTAPYGAASHEALSALGLNPENMRLVFGENIAQTFAFVASGGTDGGMVAASQLVADSSTPGCRWPIPANLYPPLVQKAVLLQRGADNPAAQAFFDFLSSTEAREQISAAGYLPP
ncbi:MAG TPA: molybdate ABC transporter substrate-binding protein [Chromatiaceae bacterium]|nr:molybdate ABC transporter substrate-binding protein [Chromatiaceae bacterium]